MDRELVVPQDFMLCGEGRGVFILDAVIFSGEGRGVCLHDTVVFSGEGRGGSTLDAKRLL